MPVWTPEPTLPAPVLPLSALGDLIWQRLPAYMRKADDGTLYALCLSLGAPVEALASMLRDHGLLTDPSRVPFERLPWLAALAGIDLTGVPNDLHRSVIPDPSWRYRGSLDAIRRRVGVTLTGARQVTVVCPYLGDPLAIYVRTLASETPDPDATEAAIRAEVPAWLVLTTEVGATGQSYNALASDYATYNTMTATGKTYSELSSEV